MDKVLEGRTIIKGPFSDLRILFRKNIINTLVSGKFRDIMLLRTSEGVLRGLSYTIVETGMKPIIEKRVGGRK